MVGIWTFYFILVKCSVMGLVDLAVGHILRFCWISCCDNLGGFCLLADNFTVLYGSNLFKVSYIDFLVMKMPRSFGFVI